jgi:hypothetical protein
LRVLCGKSDHLSKRSKKCTADIDSRKQYRRHDGSLLTDPPVAPAPVIKEEEEDADATTGTVLRALTDANHVDGLPWHTVLNSDEESFYEAAGWESDDGDSSSVVVVGGNL